jgi:hypothetical protein
MLHAIRSETVMPRLRITKFVRDLEVELQRRGFRRAASRSAALEWKRASAWRNARLGLHVEIRGEHELRLMFPDGSWRRTTARDFADAIKAIDAGEIRAEFGSDREKAQPWQNAKT